MPTRRFVVSTADRLHEDDIIRLTDEMVYRVTEVLPGAFQRKHDGRHVTTVTVLRTNTTGETKSAMLVPAQPALPGAETVRETENPTPAYALPEQTPLAFELTAQPVPRGQLASLLTDDNQE